MTVGVAPPPDVPQSAVVTANVGLAAASKLLPNRDQVPDVTGGFGATVYGSSQDGINLITAGPVFAVLELLGLDLGQVPLLPGSVAAQVNGTPYLKLGLDDILGGLHIPGLPDFLHARLTPTIGIGLGAFTAAMAYQQMIDDLKNQPGGSEWGGAGPLLGSLTILPMILLDNPARPGGGALARIGALAKLFGMNTVNPRTELTGDGGPLGNIAPLGLHLGGANVLPILVDATYEYRPLSDLASWPNPFTLLNNLAAGLVPTYMLRGSSLDDLADQLTPQLAQALEDVVAGKPLALNLYLTVHAETMPMLESLYLTSDVLNIVGLSPLAAIPMRLANALAPALSILTKLGYANVVQHPDGTYTRDFSTAGTETPLLSFPNVDYGQALKDVLTQLVGGFQKEFFSGHPSPDKPNVLAGLLDVLTGGGPTSTTPNPLGGLDDLLDNILGGLLGNVFGALNSPAAQQTRALTASSVPSSTARMVSLAATAPTGSADENASPATATKTDPKDGAVQDQPEALAPEGDTPDDATEPEADDETGPAHAKPDDGSQAGGDATPPKHAKPDDDKLPDTTTKDETPSKHGPRLNVVRGGANASSPQDAKPGAETGAETGKKDAEPTGAADASAASGTSTGDPASGAAA